MTTNALHALLYGLRTSGIQFTHACLINSVFDLSLSDIFTPSNADVVSPYAHQLEYFKAHHFDCRPTIEDHRHYDLFVIFPSKQRDHALYDIASVLNYAAEGDKIALCAANDAGGGRLASILEAFGIEPKYSYAKNRCKILIAEKTASLKKEAVSYCISQGGYQRNNAEYHSKPGVYGWNKIDVGSALLSETLPTTLLGKGADFGCGYGYLTDQVFTKSPDVEHMACMDSDYFALEACRRNIDERHKTRKYAVAWTDLRKASPAQQLNFIVMNPPFHDGKETDNTLAKDMMTTAHAALGQYGELYMVANTHLPYEAILNELFFKVDVLAQEKGFKIFKALK